MLTLDETKLHLKVEQVAEDSLIQSLIDAATAATADYLNMPVAMMTTTAPSPIKAAALLMVAGLYLNREDQSDRQLYRNDTYHRLLAPYRAMAL